MSTRPGEWISAGSATAGVYPRQPAMAPMPKGAGALSARPQL